MSPSPSSNRALTSVVVIPLVAALVVAALGWLLWQLLTGVIVMTTYALGAVLVVAPLLLWKRLVGDRAGRARIERIGSIVATVLLGVALLAVANLVSRHGWLLVAVPAAVVLVPRMVAGLRAQREPTA
jgi:FtsH-binding integral membrane protein